MIWLYEIFSIIRFFEETKYLLCEKNSSRFTCTYVFIVCTSCIVLRCIMNYLLNDVSRKISKSRIGQHFKKKKKKKRKKDKKREARKERKRLKWRPTIEMKASFNDTTIISFCRGNNNTPNCTGSLAGLGGPKSGGNTPMNPSLQQRISFLQSHLSQAPMPSVATK